MKGWKDNRKRKRRMAREKCRNAEKAEQANALHLKGKAQAIGYFRVGSPDTGKR